MKILGALLVSDKRRDTFDMVYKQAKKLPIDLKTFAFSDQKISKECDFVFDRPTADKSKLSCSFWNLATGMRESELMQLSWLRNKALEIADSYDAILFIDSDVVLPKDAIERLLICDSDIAMGWYFHKRLNCSPVNYIGFTPEKFDNDFNSKKIVNGKSGGNGACLYKKKVYNKLKYKLYNGVKAEDTEYQEKASDNGFSIKIDLGLHCDHLGDDWKPKAKEFAIKKSKLWNVKTPSFK